MINRKEQANNPLFYQCIFEYILEYYTISRISPIHFIKQLASYASRLCVIAPSRWESPPAPHVL